MTVGALLLSLHVLGAMAWVGGMLFALAVLRPGSAFLDAPARHELHARVVLGFCRLVSYIWPAMLVTGLAMDELFYAGVLAAPWPVQVMTATGALMSGVFLAILFGPCRAIRRALVKGGPLEAAVALDRIRTLTAVNLGIGVVTTIVAMLDV